MKILPQIYFFFFVLLNFVSFANTKTAKPKSTDIQNINLFINEYQLSKGDTIQAKIELKPLLDASEPEFNILYHVLMAKVYAISFDNINAKSEYHFNIAFNLTDKNVNKSLFTWSKFNYVEYLYFYRSISQAIPELLLTLEIANKLEYDKLIQPAKMYKLAGWIFQTIEEPLESKKYLEKALLFSNNELHEKADVLNALGYFYFKEENYNLAEKYFKETLDFSFKNKNYLRYARALGSLSEIEKSKGNYDKAINLVKQDLNFSIKYNDPQNTMYAYVLLAKLYLKINEKDLAKQALTDADKIAKTKSYFGSHEHEIMQLKIDLLDGQNPNEELELRRKYAELDKIIDNTDGDKAIERINWNLQKQKFQNEIFQANLIAQNNKYKSLLVLVILVLLIIFTVFVFYSNKQKLKITDIKAQESERARIAGDLHDNIINKLTVIRLKFILNHDAKEVDALLQNVIDESRNLSHKLFPPMLEDSKLEDVLSQVLSNWKNHFVINYTVSNPNNITFDNQVKQHVIRIVQELTQNTFKHAKASVITISFDVLDKHLKLKFADNGIGFDPTRDKNGIGLQNIQIRTEVLKATFKIKNVVNGSKFVLTVPL